MPTLLTTPPVAPQTLAALQALGIRRVEELHDTGSVQAFLLLKAAGLTVTRSTLWQLEALLLGIKPQDLPQTHKNALEQAVKNHPPVSVFPTSSEMETFMRAALVQAEQSALIGEIPVGAVVVSNNQIIAAAHNTCVNDHDISRHAEIRALAAAGAAFQNYRLDECDLYITLEPCAMCASAIIQARVRRVIYGAAEPKTGAAGSVVNLFANPLLNKHTAIKGSILEDECKAVLQEFFQTRRKQG